jgi:hypothetical protein
MKRFIFTYTGMIFIFTCIFAAGYNKADNDIDNHAMAGFINAAQSVQREKHAAAHAIHAKWHHAKPAKHQDIFTIALKERN